MDINNSPEPCRRTFRAEFQVCIVSTSHDARAEREVLHRDVFPRLHHRLSERGGVLRVNDPRWEAMLAPNDARQIVKAGLENLYGYRPVFIGILGSGESLTGTYPWLQDMAGDPDIAVQFMSRVVNCGMMRDRAWFYILDTAGSKGSATDAASHGNDAVRHIIERARRDNYIVRDGISTLDALACRVLNDLEMAFEHMDAKGGGASAAERDRRVQAQVADEHRLGYVEIGSYLDRLHDLILNQGNSVVVVGESGAGKSALLVNWVDHIRASLPDVVVLSRFVDASSGDDLVSVLRYLMLDLQEYCGIQDSLSDDAATLVEQFPQWLAHTPSDRIVVVVVDGVDRLAAGAPSLSWLPQHLPRNVRLVVSGVLVELPVSRTWSELRIEPLTLAQTRAITDRLVAESGSLSAPELVQRLVGASLRPSPFFLRTIVRYAQSASPSGGVDALSDVGTVEELMDRILQQGEERYGPLTGRVLALLCCARKGLAREDLLALTAADPEMLSGVLAEFKPYMVNRDGLLAYIHDHVRRAVERRYIAGDERQFHADLAGYFAARPIDERRIEEEPWHWQRAEDCDRLTSCVTDIPMFLAFFSEDRQFELLGYCVAVDDSDRVVADYEKCLSQWQAGAPGISENARVLECLGGFFTTAGWFAPAERYLRAALELKRELYGEMHVSVAHTLHDLAELLRRAGRYVEAENCYVHALAIREEQLDPLAPEIAEAVSDLALLYRDLRRPDQALPLYLRAVDLKERIHGSNHSATAESLNDLALLYHDLGDLEAAVALNKRALEIREKWYGSNHPVVATSHNNLGSVYRDLGNPDAAEREYRRSLAIGEDRLGADHPHTIGTVANLASLMLSRGALDEARSLFLRAIDTTIRTLGADHPNVSAFTINYAQVLRGTGDLDGTEEILRTRLHRLLAAAEPQPYVPECANNLAVILQRQERDEEALAFYAIAVEWWEQSLHPNHPNVASALHNMAAIRFRIGDAAVAEPLVRRALAIRTEYFSADHDLTRQSAALLVEITGSSGAGG